MGNLITNYSFSLHCSFQELIMDVGSFRKSMHKRSFINTAAFKCQRLSICIFLSAHLFINEGSFIYKWALVCFLMSAR